jgi:CubicO group peptidase (beta-lactamase class C family)
MSHKVSSICIKVMPVLCFLLFLQPAIAQYNWTELNKELEARQQLLGNNVVCLLWKGDSLIYKKEMGGFNSKTEAPIASCSKWLTAALVMQFVDEGKLSLDDKVGKYIPEFDKYFKSGITIRQCLCHMTGIADDKNFLKRILERRKFSSLEEEVNSFAAREIRATPGTDFWYGNIGLNIAGRVLEIISKKKFELLIKTKLLTPLEMTKTTFNDPKGYPVNPSGGAQSTAEDYMKFLVMLLKKGKYKGQQILSEKAVQLMKEVQDKPEQIKYAPKAAEGFTYASGSWAMADTIKREMLEADKPFYKPGQIPVAGVDYREKRIATVLTSPGLFGTWPMIDFCRGYAYIVFVKNLLGEERADAHIGIKKIIDKQIASMCK